MSPEFINWRELRSPYPHNLIIDIHSYCNGRCKICPFPELKDRLPMGFMDTDLFKRIIDEFAAVKTAHGIRGHVIFCNMGELFMDPDVFWKIAYVQERDLVMPLQTNAAMMTPKKVDRLVGCGFKGDIFISFHGITQEVYEDIMGLPYEKTLANVHYLLDHYDRGKIHIRPFAYKWPTGEGRKLRDYWSQYGLRVRIRIPNARSGLLGKLAGARLKYPGPYLRGCKKTLPFRDMVITFDGKAILCCEDMARKTELGDVNGKTLLDVWNSEKAYEIMDFMHGGGWGKNDEFICRRCEFGLSTQFRRLVKNLNNQLRLLSYRN